MADNKKVANSWENALAEHGKIPGTSLAVMIFILLVAFACTGVQVVTGLVEAEHAPEEIKGKYTQGTGDAAYPTAARLPEGVAARVNGVDILESQVTDYIIGIRERLQLEDQEAWDEWMINNGRSTEAIRNQVLLYFINLEMLTQIAEERDITITDADYDAFLEDLKSDPESLEVVEANLAAEGYTVEDREALTLAVMTDVIGARINEAILDTPEFKDAVLEYVKRGAEEYKDVTSLDQVDPAVVEQVTKDVAKYSNRGALGFAVDDFVEAHDVLYQKLDEDVSYQSNADTYFQEMAIRQMLNKNGLFIPEDQGILDGLIAKLTESAQKSE